MSKWASNLKALLTKCKSIQTKYRSTQSCHLMRGSMTLLFLPSRTLNCLTSWKRTSKSFSFQCRQKTLSLDKSCHRWRTLTRPAQGLSSPQSKLLSWLTQKCQRFCKGPTSLSITSSAMKRLRCLSQTVSCLKLLRAFTMAKLWLHCPRNLRKKPFVTSFKTKESLAS